jgi:hypothetical protein
MITKKGRPSYQPNRPVIGEDKDLDIDSSKKKSQPE